MESNLNILEAKVLEAINLIKEEDTNGRLNHELDEARASVVDVEVYEEKRKEIEVKVGGLLQQLEALG